MKKNLMVKLFRLWLAMSSFTLVGTERIPGCSSGVPEDTVSARCLPLINQRRMRGADEDSR